MFIKIPLTNNVFGLLHSHSGYNSHFQIRVLISGTEIITGKGICYFIKNILYNIGNQAQCSFNIWFPEWIDSDSSY